MDQDRFATLTRSLTNIPSRRDTLRGLAGAGLGVLSLPGNVEAKKKAKHTKKKSKKKDKKHKNKPQPHLPLVFNAYGCLEVGQSCRGDSSLCCAGICEGIAPGEGQPDTSRCIAHNTGTCQQAGPGICLSDAPENLGCNNNGYCRCFTTTAGSNVCAEFFPRACASCQRDADCVAQGFPAGSACTPFAAGFCGGQCASGMACITPCGVELPPPPPDM